MKLNGKIWKHLSYKQDERESKQKKEQEREKIE